MSTEKIKLLVVDDMEGIREGVAFYFQKKGYIVFTAESAEQALPIIKEERLDLIITDMNLLGMSGMDLVKLVRQFNSAVKVIMVSGANLNFYMEPRFRKLNISQLIPKPLTFDELESAVTKELGLIKKGE
jgi:two-component system response regulator (stage 0 sporulation protein F)